MLSYFKSSIERSCYQDTGELLIPILNILFQNLFINFIDSNTLFQYDVDKLIELDFITSLS
jgi:hypothetical protein